MVRFLTYLPADVQKGDPALIQQVVDTFAEKLQTGLIEIECTPSKQCLILLSDGQVVGGNVVETASDSTLSCQEIPYEQLSTHWQNEELVSVRSLQVNLQNVRAIRVALAWFPPNRSIAVQSGELQKSLETSQADKQNGLFRVSWEGGEAYLFVFQGQLLQGESVLNLGSESVTGGQAYEQLLAQVQEPLSLEFYEADLESSACQMLCFRSAFAQLLQGILSRYTRLVGADLVESLASTMNQYMEERRYHLGIYQNQLYDVHVFPDMVPAMRVYRTFFRNVIGQISAMVGSNLAHSIAFDAFKGISPEKQQFLRESPLMLLIISTS